MMDYLFLSVVHLVITVVQLVSVHLLVCALLVILALKARICQINSSARLGHIV
jgi:hypothetical protein